GFSIEGTGTAPWAGMAPSLTFPLAATGSSSVQQIPVRNVGTSSLHVNGANIVPSGSGFTLDSQTCGDVPRGGACELDVRFTHGSAGNASAVLTLVDDEVTAQPVSLSGTSLPPGPCTSVNLTPSLSSPQPTGATVTLTASAAGCPSPRFRFWTQVPNGPWRIAQDYSASNTFVWQSPATGLAGANGLEVDERDASESVSYDVAKNLTYQL